jgi:hypothetical protein
MAAAELLARLENREKKAGNEFHALAVRAVEGNAITDQEIDDACELAGKRASDFAALIKTLVARKAAVDAYDARDWAAERAANIAERRQLTTSAAGIDAELTALKAENARLQDALRKNLHSARQRDSDEQTLRSERDTTLRATGDARDWRTVNGSKHGG